MQRALIGALLLSLSAALVPLAARAEGASSAGPTRDAHTFVRASMGGSARALYDADVLGGEVDAGIGIDTRVGAYSLVVAFFAGSTTRDFLTLQGTAGVDMAWPVSVFHFGLTPRIGYVGLSRLTTDRQFGAYTFGVALHGSVDLHANKGTTVALGLEPTAEVAISPGADGPGEAVPAPLLGGRAFIEVRYDVE